MEGKDVRFFFGLYNGFITKVLDFILNIAITSNSLVSILKSLVQYSKAFLFSCL